MNDLIEAQKDFYNILTDRKATYSKGKFIEKKTFMEKYNIPEEAIIEVHNGGKVLDVYAPCFNRMSRIAIPGLNEKQRFGEYIMPRGYTLIDLHGVPKAALYGQINTASGKRDIPGELIDALIMSQKRKEWYSGSSEMDKLLEKARLQKNYSPRERIQNARRVIEGADLDGLLESGYVEQKKVLEEGMTATGEILSGIADCQFMLTKADGSALPKEAFREFFATYPGPTGAEVHFDDFDMVSRSLEHIEKCKKILNGYNLQESDINSILSVPLGSLPTAWIEVK